MQALYSYLKEHPVTYVTRQRERAEGLPEGTPGYFIYTDTHKSTREILASSEFQKHQTEHKSDVLVFKSNRQEEELAKNMDWKILNPNAELAEKVESKVGQVRWLGGLVRYLPPHAIKSCRDLRYDYGPVIVQFNHAHSGLGTTLLDSEVKTKQLAEKFPNRPVRVTKYIKGAVYTNNNVVAGKRVLLGNTSYQITGLIGLSDNPFATVGNDFGLPGTLGEAERGAIRKITKEVGERLVSEGWRGCFGGDFIVEEDSKTVYLIEINARQTASVVFESKLQKENSEAGVSTFEAHLAALVGLDYGEELINITKGGRFLRRLTGRNLPAGAKNKLRDLGFETITFEPEKEGDDLLHIRSSENLMQVHGVPSELGRQAIETLIQHD